MGEPGLYLVWTVSSNYWSGAAKLVRPGGLKGRNLTRVQLDDELDNKIVTDRPAPKIVRTIQQAGTAYDGRPLPEIPAGDLTLTGTGPVARPPRRRTCPRTSGWGWAA